MTTRLKCPVCRKPLTQAEYDKALGLWRAKQEHIKHLEVERKALRRQEQINRRSAKRREREFKKREAELHRETKRILAHHRSAANKRLRDQRASLERAFNRRMKDEVKVQVGQEVADQKKQLAKQAAEFRKSRNKMAQLEKSLAISARKYDQANEEIKKLKQQIESGITPQIEGLLEEGKLLSKLKELFPQDRFDHPGKAGDIIQTVVERGNDIGKIVYECKRVKHFNRKHIDQARDARETRRADFAVLVTNAFPSKKQYYFVQRSVFVISPISLEPVTYTLRESLVRISLLRITNQAKARAVQRVYDYLSGNEYNNKINGMAGQLLELGKDLKSEIAGHKRTWVRRYHIYKGLFSDITLIDYRLKDLVQPALEQKARMLPPPKKAFIEIEVM